jgi:hypothetical protein
MSIRHSTGTPFSRLSDPTIDPSIGLMDLGTDQQEKTLTNIQKKINDEHLKFTHHPEYKHHNTK